MLHLTNLIGFGAGSTSPAIATYEATGTTSGVEGGSYSWTGLSFGTASSNRYMVACIFMEGAFTVTGVTIGGVTASSVASKANGNSNVSMWIAAVPTGTSGTVAVTSTAPGGSAIYLCTLYSLTGNASATAAGTISSSASPPTGTLTTAAGTAVIAASMDNNNSPTWTGVSQDALVTTSTPSGTSGHSNVSSGGSLTVTCSWASESSPVMVAGAWNG